MSKKILISIILIMLFLTMITFAEGTPENVYISYESNSSGFSYANELKKIDLNGYYGFNSYRSADDSYGYRVYQTTDIDIHVLSVIESPDDPTKYRVELVFRGYHLNRMSNFQINSSSSRFYLYANSSNIQDTEYQRTIGYDSTNIIDSWRDPYHYQYNFQNKRKYIYDIPKDSGIDFNVNSYSSFYHSNESRLYI